MSSVKKPHCKDDDFAAHAAQMRARARKLNVLPADVDDVVNEALVDAYESEKQPPLDKRDEVLAWLLELVYWQAKSYFKRRARKSREVPLSESEAAALIVVDEGASRQVQIIEERASILSALRLVRPKLRNVVLARYVHEQKLDEYAASVGICEETAKTRLARGRQEMLKALETVDEPNRRRGVLFPFFPGLDAFWRKLVKAAGRFFVDAPLRWGTSSVIAAGLVLAPPSSISCAGEVEELEAQAAVVASAAVRVQERRQGEGRICPAVQAPGTGELVHSQARTETDGAAPKKPKSGSANQPPRKATASDEGLLAVLIAKAALQHGEPDKAKETLDSVPAKQAGVAGERERAILRAVAERK